MELKLMERQMTIQKLKSLNRTNNGIETFKDYLTFVNIYTLNRTNNGIETCVGCWPRSGDFYS